MTRLLISALAVSTLFACVGDKSSTDDTAPVTDDSEGDADADSDSDSDTDADTDSDSDADVSGFDGVMSFVYGFDTDPNAFACVLFWNTTGSASSADACADCEWELDFNLAYDSANSDDTGGCHDGSDFSWTLGYDQDYYGYYEVMWYYSPTYGDWSPVWGAAWDGTNLVFGGGYYQYPYSYNGADYYYTRTWYGYGTTN
jgi:hypothetical protein